LGNREINKGKTLKLSPAAHREENWGWLMVAPTIIGLVILNVWPFIQTLYASFCEHLGFGHYQFIGLDNYITMFTSSEFWRATWNTILFCILTVPVGIFLALLVAILLNSKIKGRGAFRTIFFLPMVALRRRSPWSGAGSSTASTAF
jgi:multiple sugar transport system permease protein